jgi:hypothetical protein
LSDEALGEICTETRIEGWLLLGGCLGTVAAFLLLVVTLLIFRDLAPPLFLASVLTVTVLFWGHHLVRLPKRQYREELAYRQGLGPRARYVAEAEAILREKAADWVFLFTLRSLPHGGFWWLRLAVNEGPPASARADLRVLPRRERPFFKRVEREVPEALVQDLSSFLKELDLAALTDMLPAVLDGGPCCITVLRREPWLVASAGCNLGGLTAELLQHPTAALCTKLSDIAWHLTPRSQ